MVLTDPVGWVVVDQSDAAVVERARVTENDFGSRFSHVYPLGEPWEYRVTEDDVNAWLGVRLGKWLLNQNVSANRVEVVERTRVVFTPRGFELACQPPLSQTDWVNPVVSLVFVLGKGDGGMLTVNLDSARVGAVGVPLDLVFEELEANGALLEGLGGVGERFKGRAGALKEMLSNIELDMPLLDGRKVRVLEVQMAKGAALLKCVTEKAD